jgi:phosphoribosylanthranilate isomerase
MFPWSAMAVRIKFCGLTRAIDVDAAVRLGCDYVGVIFAGGPRNRTLAEAAEILRGATSVGRVGVFGSPDSAELARFTAGVPLSIAQLHGAASPAAVRAARSAGVREVWAVAAVRDGALADGAGELFQCADAVVLDTGARNGLGGTGRVFDWVAISRTIGKVRGCARLVVAGGLTPDNVAEAIRCLAPDVVDVSSGVESAPGVKDPILMRRFVEAARSA